MKQQKFATTRRSFLKQGAAFGLAGAGVLATGAIARGLPLVSGTRAGRSANSSGPARVYVFASDPRAGLPGFHTIPG